MLFFLGYSVFEDNGPAMRSINSLDVKEAIAGPTIRSLLRDLRIVKDQLMGTVELAQAIEDGAIKVRAHYTLDHLCRLGRILVTQLARFTKISVDGDVFSVGTNARDGSAFYAAEPSGI